MNEHPYMGAVELEVRERRQPVELGVESRGSGTDLSLGIVRAAVGDLIKVKAVDDNGAPTAWEIAVPVEDYGTYSKPSGGIPASDLAEGVQTSLGKANTALQEVPNTYRTAAAQDVIDATKQAKITASGILKGDGSGGVSAAVAGTDYGTYSKPSGGIPASDLAEGVIPTVPAAYTGNPSMGGTASPGRSGSWARGDHVHPTDTGRADAALYTADGVSITLGTNTAQKSIVVTDQDATTEGYYILHMGSGNAKKGPGLLLGSKTTLQTWATGWDPALANYAAQDGKVYGKALGVGCLAIGTAQASPGAQYTDYPALALGSFAITDAPVSVAIGQAVRASGIISVCMGQYLIATHSRQFVFGSSNQDNAGDIFEIGNGGIINGVKVRSNAFRVTDDGKAIAQNALGIEDGNGGTVEITAAQLQALLNLLN